MLNMQTSNQIRKQFSQPLKEFCTLNVIVLLIALLQLLFWTVFIKLINYPATFTLYQIMCSMLDNCKLIRIFTSYHYVIKLYYLHCNLSLYQHQMRPVQHNTFSQEDFCYFLVFCCLGKRCVHEKKAFGEYYRLKRLTLKIVSKFFDDKK